MLGWKCTRMGQHSQRSRHKLATSASHEKFIEETTIPATSKKIMSTRRRHPPRLVNFSRRSAVDRLAQVDEAGIRMGIVSHEGSHPVANLLGLP